MKATCACTGGSWSVGAKDSKDIVKTLRHCCQRKILVVCSHGLILSLHWCQQGRDVFWILLMHLPFQQSKTFSPVKHFQFWWWKWEVWPGLKDVKVQIVMMPLPWLEDHWMWACDWIFPWFPCLQPSLTDASPNRLRSFGSTDFKAPVTCWTSPKRELLEVIQAVADSMQLLVYDFACSFFCT